MGGDSCATAFALENNLCARLGIRKGRARELDSDNFASRITAHSDNHKIWNLRCLVVVSEMGSERRCRLEIGCLHCNDGAHAQELADWHGLPDAYRSRAKVAVGKKTASFQITA
jgi:hypothetical protein